MGGRAAGPARRQSAEKHNSRHHQKHHHHCHDGRSVVEEMVG